MLKITAGVLGDLSGKINSSLPRKDGSFWNVPLQFRATHPGSADAIPKVANPADGSLAHDFAVEVQGVGPSGSGDSHSERITEEVAQSRRRTDLDVHMSVMDSEPLIWSLLLQGRAREPPGCPQGVMSLFHCVER